ncbi:hypothetical protein MTR62_14875 [Novosphingobium sp. 1949]|uniref:Lipoprotein n=1 Tax=Novosphingobium organovorum TaxID=2930092 RepID=A0ABT0BG55_9SPHN|nr:hypothetical protein [Novosphingobium organovorum]MCJ2183968.1 hypothetical protein [Novosphingobium organovorum]
MHFAYRPRFCGAALGALLALSACGSSKAPPPAPKPTGYRIAQRDLLLPEPRDVCRTQEAAFLRDLLLRVSQALPVGTRDFAFEDFVPDKSPEGTPRALVRFRAATGSGKARLMYASGAFDASRCTVGPLTGGIGQGPEDPERSEPFAEAAR